MLIVRATLAFLALPTMFGGVIPWLVSKIPAPVFFKWPYGFGLLLLGGGLLLPSVISFYRRGRGTLAPWDPPKHLVVQDLYRFNRNPMYVGVTTALVGWALVTGNPWNYLYAPVVFVIFHLRVVMYEERELARLFGPEWEAYRRAVPRWGFRFSPYDPTVAMPDVTVKNAASSPARSSELRNPSSSVQ